jgi:phosphatidylinositol glycan class V
LRWIELSWSAFVSQQQRGFKTSKPILFRVVAWALLSLRASADSGGGLNPPMPLGTTTTERLLLGPSMLAYYAILAAVCALGATVAHVQISTRLICSSCPAIYWYMAFLTRRQEATGANAMMSRRLLPSRNTIICYCFGYILLGIILHVNWLPWT